MWYSCVFLSLSSVYDLLNGIVVVMSNKKNDPLIWASLRGLASSSAANVSHLFGLCKVSGRKVWEWRRFLIVVGCFEMQITRKEISHRILRRTRGGVIWTIFDGCYLLALPFRNVSWYFLFSFWDGKSIQYTVYSLILGYPLIFHHTRYIYYYIYIFIYI